jgi:hypothetical protein
MEPSILPNIDILTITYIPYTAPFKNPTSSSDTLPRVARPVTLLSFEKMALRKIFCLQDSCQ